MKMNQVIDSYHGALPAGVAIATYAGDTAGDAGDRVEKINGIKAVDAGDINSIFCGNGAYIYQRYIYDPASPACGAAYGARGEATRESAALALRGYPARFLRGGEA
jgi:hypothetical protein